MSSAATQRWKSNEKIWAKILGRYGVTASRISRAGNFGLSTFDVLIEDLPELKSDTKYSIKGWKENRLLAETADAYCEKSDTAILLTKGYQETGQCATVNAEFLAFLIALWLETQPKEELLKIYHKEAKKYNVRIKSDSKIGKPTPSSKPSKGKGTDTVAPRRRSKGNRSSGEVQSQTSN